jgi:purine-binding chemotaxis protein CheW
VREILDMREIARLPHAPADLLGMIDVRSVAVPVIDLRTRFGLARVDPTPSTRIVVLDVCLGGKDRLLGLVADRVLEVTGLDGGQLEPPPETGSRWQSSHIAGIGRKGEQFVIVLDLVRLLAGDGAALAA